MAQQPVEGKPCARNESERLSATFAQGVTEGTRYPQILINTDSAPMGAPANEHGNQIYAWAPQIDVGVYSAPVGPASAGDTYFTQIREAADEEPNTASKLANSSALEPLKSGLTAARYRRRCGGCNFSRSAHRRSRHLDQTCGGVGRPDRRTIATK